MANPIVRPPTRGEVERAALIGQEAFASATADSWLNSYNWVATNYGLEFLIVVEVDGKLVSSMVCTPGAARFSDDIVPLCAVGGVATLPEYRKFGYAGLMMEESVRVLARNGYHTSALWPFSFHYYRKYGWEIGSEQRNYVVPSSLAAELGTPEGVRPALEADLPAISRLVDRFARRHNCVTVRDERWWGLILATYDGRLDGNRFPRTSRAPWVHQTEGAIDGCAVFRFSGEGDEEIVDVREIVADNPSARRSILSRLAVAGAPNILFRAPIDDGFLQEVPNPREIKALIEGGFQFRVVDPVAALELRTSNPDVAGRLGFEVVDPVLGSSSFDVEIGDGRIRRTDSRATDRLRMSEQTLAQIYCGYASPARAAELGRVEVTSQWALELADSMLVRATPFRSHLEIG